VQQRVVRVIQMHIAFVHLPAGRIEHLDDAEGRFDIFRKPDSNLIRRCLHGAAHARFRIFEKKHALQAR
jgi:hypothetical protein